MLRIAKNRTARTVSLLIALMCVVALLLILGLLIWKSLPILRTHSLGELLFSSEWQPGKGKFGFLSFILSSVFVTLIAMIFAVPVCLFTSIYLVEYGRRKALKFILPAVDILAAIPSVIYGIWGIIMVVPFISWLAGLFGIDSSGYTILAGGIVLAIMVSPIIIHVSIEVLKSIPQNLRHASLSLGATKWETIKLVVLRKAMPGLIAGVALGFSRALGEAIAVLMVAGNVVGMPKSLFAAGYPLPALLANNYGEMMSIPEYDSALMFSALLLFFLVLVFHLFSRWYLKNLRYV